MRWLAWLKIANAGDTAQTGRARAAMAASWAPSRMPLKAVLLLLLVGTAAQPQPKPPAPSMSRVGGTDVVRLEPPTARSTNRLHLHRDHRGKAAAAASSPASPGEDGKEAAAGDTPVYVGTLDGALHALDRRTGARLWRLGAGPVLQGLPQTESPEDSSQAAKQGILLPDPRNGQL